MRQAAWWGRGVWRSVSPKQQPQLISHVCDRSVARSFCAPSENADFINTIFVRIILYKVNGVLFSWLINKHYQHILLEGNISLLSLSVSAFFFLNCVINFNGHYSPTIPLWKNRVIFFNDLRLLGNCLYLTFLNKFNVFKCILTYLVKKLSY